MLKTKSSQGNRLRKIIKPVIDIDEDDDDKRRDLSGRKRVDVIECLLETSSDENDDDYNYDYATYIRRTKQCLRRTQSKLY